MFADDTNIFISDSNSNRLEELVCRELKLYLTMFAVNRLLLNVGRTNNMVFNNMSRYKFNVSVDGRCLQPVNSVKFLEFYIELKLS